MSAVRRLLLLLPLFIASAPLLPAGPVTLTFEGLPDSTILINQFNPLREGVHLPRLHNCGPEVIIHTT